MPSSQTDRLKGLTTSVAVKASVLVASTGNLSLSSTQVIDGVAVSTERVLAKDQTTVSENGIYDADSGAWSRAKDFDGGRDAVQGTVVYVNSGTANGDLWFRVSSTGGNIPGTDNITFAQSAGLTATNELVGALDTNDNAIDESEGTAIASDSTTNIWADDGNTVHVTGTVTIASFSTAPRVGAVRRVIFDAALSLTHSTTAMILPGSTTIVTEADDSALVYAESTVLSRVYFDPISGRQVITETIETVSSTGEIISGLGITILSTDLVTDLTYPMSAPAAGVQKEIHIQTSATLISLETTAASIKFNTTSVVAAAGGTSLVNIANMAAAGIGGVIVLRGLSATAWAIVSQPASMTVST